MSSVASVVQYPLPCPECKNYTSQPAEKLRTDRKSTCRVCGNVIRLTDQQLESLERTLSHMSGCGLRGGQSEIGKSQDESQDEYADDTAIAE